MAIGVPTVNHTINEADQKFPVNIHLLGHREAIIHFFSDMVIVKVRKFCISDYLLQCAIHNLNCTTQVVVAHEGFMNV